ncbi:MAG: transposase [Planctomycetota bacterium]|nr:transposase [Planctomycetota bacterium]
MQKLAQTVRTRIEEILAYAATRLSNGRTKELTVKIRTITRRSFGFLSGTGLISLIFRCCSGIDLKPMHR